jgi:hypothetical protein
MKNFQSALLQDPGQKEIQHLCNFHTWGLAATQRAVTAARVFQGLLAKDLDESLSPACDICLLLQLEEQLRIREFIGCLEHKLVSQWLRSQAELCIAHGTKLKNSASPVLMATVGSIMERYRNRLVDELARLTRDDPNDNAQWGLLGHAAEFLAAQRGLRP